MSRYGAGQTLRRAIAHRVWPRRPEPPASMVGRTNAPFRDRRYQVPEWHRPGLQCRCNVPPADGGPSASPSARLGHIIPAMPPRFAATFRRARRARRAFLVHARRGRLLERHVRPVRPVHRGRPGRRRLPGSRGASSRGRSTAARPTRLDSGRNCTCDGASTLASTTASRSCSSPARRGAPGRTPGRRSRSSRRRSLQADWVHEFFLTGAENASTTETVDESKPAVERPVRRSGSTPLNGESYQTVIDWQDGDRVRRRARRELHPRRVEGSSTSARPGGARRRAAAEHSPVSGSRGPCRNDSRNARHGPRRALTRDRWGHTVHMITLARPTCSCSASCRGGILPILTFIELARLALGPPAAPVSGQRADGVRGPRCRPPRRLRSPPPRRR